MSRYKEEYKPTNKDLLIYNAPDAETKEFIEDLTTVENKTDFNNIRNTKKKYNNIIAKYPKFLIHPSNHNRSYNYKKWLNKTISQFQPKGDLYDLIKSFKGVPENEELDKETTTQINQWIKEEIRKNEEEYMKNQEQQHKEELEKQQAKANKEKEEATRNIRAEDNKDKEKKLSDQKNKTEEIIKKQEERIKQLEEENQYKVNPRLKDYLRDHYIIDSPMTREELYEKVANDPHLLATNENHINKYVDYILGKQLRRLITSKNKIIKTAKLFGNDAEYLNKLDPSVREAVLKYQTDLINKTIIDKNNKYLLPKKYIKFEKAINNYKVNPLILRGLYVK